MVYLYIYRKEDGTGNGKKRKRFVLGPHAQLRTLESLGRRRDATVVHVQLVLPCLVKPTRHLSIAPGRPRLPVAGCPCYCTVQVLLKRVGVEYCKLLRTHTHTQLAWSHFVPHPFQCPCACERRSGTVQYGCKTLIKNSNLIKQTLHPFYSLSTCQLFVSFPLLVLPLPLA